MDTVPLHLLSPASSRELTTRLVRSATGLPPASAHTLTLTLDAVSAAVIRTAGISVDDARRILASLWQHPPRYAEPTPAAGPLRPGINPTAQAEHAYRRDLGQRIHVVRHARRLTPAGVLHRSSIPPYALREIETGDLWPSGQQLYRLAHAFAVPVPMLVDPKATPLRVLRLLSGQTA